MNIHKKTSVCSLLVMLLIFTYSKVIFSKTQNDKSSENVKDSGFIFIPAFFYSPETKIAGGASVIYYYRSANSAPTVRPSTIQPTFIYTQKNQIITSVLTDLYWREETYRLNGAVSFKKYPDKFFGVGSETTDAMEEDYRPKTFAFFLNLFRKVRPGLNFGLLYEYRHDSITETEENGLLASGNINGSDGGTVSGAGILVNWDTRDNIFYPTKGSFHQFSAAFFGSALGSNFSFNRYVLDLRKYVSLSASGVFAFQGFASFTTSNPSFQFLSQFGGQNIMRGYYEGRYRDKHGFVLQTEYRQRLFGRIGLVGFLGLGEVASELDGFDLEEARISVGLGLRYLYSSTEGINVRIAVGFSGGTPGPYITINEAF